MNFPSVNCASKIPNPVSAPGHRIIYLGGWISCDITSVLTPRKR